MRISEQTQAQPHAQPPAQVQTPVPTSFPSARWGDRWRRIIGEPVELDLGRFREPLAHIHELGRALAGLSDSALTERARSLRARARARAQDDGAGAPPNELRPELFALVRECARRAVGLAPYDEHLIAGLAMSEGKATWRRRSPSSASWWTMTSWRTSRR